jgi:mannose-6-phosphate isomerase-like protein (cupin superfamily)
LKSSTGTLRREDALSLSGSHGAEFVGDGDPDATTYGVNHLRLADLLAAPSRQGQSYAENLLRVQALSAGVYELPAGADDLQEPHTEDEVYLVLRGQAQATVGGDTVAVTTGSFLYVPARVPHRFHDIEEHLAVLVVFAPAEGTGVG